MSVTDRERREVAARLRERQGSIGRDEDSRELTKWDDLAAIVLRPEQFHACMRFKNRDNRTQAIRSVIAGRLADLIEPPVRSSKAIRAEASRLDWNDLAPKSDIAAMWELADQVDAACAPIDREALLALADEMDDSLQKAVWNQTPGVRREHIMSRYARRIREALGAEG